MIVFVYEDICASAAGGDDESPPAASLLREGRAMRDAVTADFRRVPGIEVISLSPPLRFGEGAGGRGLRSASQTSPPCPPLRSGEGGRKTEDDFERCARTADYTLVIAPETGGRLEHLASEVVRVGGKLLGPSPEAIRLTSDKLALARHWEAHRVSTPQTWILGEQSTQGTMVVKPRDGAGSQAIACGTFRAADSQIFLPLPPLRGERVGVRGVEARRHETQSHDPASATPSPQPSPPKRGRGRKSSLSASESAGAIAQQYVPGFAASVAFLIGPRATIPLIPCAQRLSTDGHFQYEGGYLPIAPDLANRATRIAMCAIQSVPGLLGYVGVDVILGDDGRDWAIEINPRLTTSYVGLRALAEFNIAEAMLAIVRGDSPPVMSWENDPIQFTPDGQVSPLAA